MERVASEGGMGCRVSVGAVLALLLGGGCFSPPPEAKARLEATRLEAEEVLRAVDGLEERFLGNQAKLLLWQELARRHRSVSALACENARSHALEMATQAGSQERKARTQRSRRQQVRAAAVSEAPRAEAPQRSN